MKIERPPLLRDFRQPGYCDVCGRWAPIREPHHLRRKGMGGTPIDVRINLASVGGLLKLDAERVRFTCHCHRLIHDGKIPAAKVLSVVAAREKTTPELITEVMDWMVRLIRPTDTQLREALLELSPPAYTLAVRELTEAGISV